MRRCIDMLVSLVSAVLPCRARLALALLLAMPLVKRFALVCALTATAGGARAASLGPLGPLAGAADSP